MARSMSRARFDRALATAKVPIAESNQAGASLFFDAGPVLQLHAPAAAVAVPESVAGRESVAASMLCPSPPPSMQSSVGLASEHAPRTRQALGHAVLHTLESFSAQQVSGPLTSGNRKSVSRSAPVDPKLERGPKASSRPALNCGVQT
jgi:hypothetical protein